MGTKARYKPEHLASKLLAIRQRLGLSQSQIASLLELNVKRPTSRVSEYENSVREPHLCLLLNYARLIGVTVDVLIDDSLNLPKTVKLKRRRPEENFSAKTKLE